MSKFIRSRAFFPRTSRDLVLDGSPRFRLSSYLLNTILASQSLENISRHNYISSKEGIFWNHLVNVFLTGILGQNGLNREIDDGERLP
jgi:hypothetical protein